MPEYINTRNESVTRSAYDPGLTMTHEDIDRFLEDWKAKGCSDGTLDRYRYNLNRLYRALPADKKIRRGTLSQWRENLLESGYAPNTVNMIFSVCNTYLDYLGYREYQQADKLELKSKLQPELTRNEYLHLLRTAKNLGRERAYLLVKLFAITGIHVQELSKVTVEATQSGSFVVSVGSARQTIRLPECLRQELLDYVRRKGIASGPIFITREGTPMSRNNVSTGIRQLSEAAGIPAEKGNPRCLRKLYQNTKAGVEANISLLVEQAMDRQLEQEQLSVGWDMCDM